MTIVCVCAYIQSYQRQCLHLKTSSIFKYIQCFILNRIFVSEKPFLHGQWQFDNLFCKCDITIAGMRSFLNSVFFNNVQNVILNTDVGDVN